MDYTNVFKTNTIGQSNDVRVLCDQINRIVPEEVYENANNFYIFNRKKKSKEIMIGLGSRILMTFEIAR